MPRIHGPDRAAEADEQVVEDVGALAGDGAAALVGDALARDVRLGVDGPRAWSPPESLPVSAGEYVRMTVRDEGPGVDDELAARIFQPFVTSKPAGEGTGLGLAIAQSIALDLGGWIAFENEATGGARFELYLPATTRADAS